MPTSSVSTPTQGLPTEKRGLTQGSGEPLRVHLGDELLQILGQTPRRRRFHFRLRPATISHLAVVAAAAGGPVLFVLLLNDDAGNGGEERSRGRESVGDAFR